ncbi:MAG TPA: MFS transporter [Hyphomicrobiaceae bacterium]|jgi:MFS family permease|nr:MFS transporter [Hyphomicrobiaceae bacterium]
MLKPNGLFYGWYIVAAIALITTTTSGLVFYNLSVLLDAFVAERGFPVGLTSTATATFFISSGVGGAVAGRLVDRIDVRAVIATSATIGAIALSCVGSLRELWHLYAFHVVFGLAHGATSLVPVTTLITRWFNVRRALAFSLASTGLSLGGILVAPIVSLLILDFGLSGAAPWMGLAMFLGIVPVTLLVLRPDPKAMGLAPDGPRFADERNALDQPMVSFAEARRSLYFYAVSTAYLFLLGSQVGAIAHFYRLVNVRSGPHTAALALAFMASASTAGRLAGGGLLLKVRARWFALVLMLVQAASLALLAGATEPTSILTAAVLFGVTIGNSLMMHPLLLAERFGPRDYGRIYSTSQLVTMIGVAGGPALVGCMYEATGGYVVPFLAISALTLIGFAVFAVYGSERDLETTA